MDERLNAAVINLVEKSPTGIVVVEDKKVILISAGICAFLDVERNQVEGKTLDNLPTAISRVLKELKDPILIPGNETREAKWLRSAMISADKEANITAYFVQDVTQECQIRQEVNRLQEELKSLTVRDNVTGLPNRLALMQALEPLISRSRRYDNPLAIIRLKINELPNMDIAFGAGSQHKALLCIAQLLRDQLRWADVIGRYEDDEFLLVLPETSAEAATGLIEKISSKINETKISGDEGMSFPLSVNYGAAAWTKGDDAKKLLQRAQASLNISH